MESFELRIFKEVAYAGSVTGAAASLNYVQSNVTAHIKKLEEELGTSLFIRHAKGVTLTEDGEKLLKYADAVLNLLDHAASEFRKECFTLKIGATQTLAASRLPGWIAGYQKKYPDVACSAITDRQDNLISFLENGEVDCAFVEPQYMTPHVKSVYSFKEKLSIIAPAGSSLDNLCGCPLIVNNIETCPYRKLLQSWVFARTHSIPATVEFDTVEAITNAVALGAGISLLPSIIASGNGKVCAFQPPEIGSLTIHMVASCNQQKKEVCQFMDMVIQNPDSRPG